MARAKQRHLAASDFRASAHRRAFGDARIAAQRAIGAALGYQQRRRPALAPARSAAHRFSAASPQAPPASAPRPAAKPPGADNHAYAEWIDRRAHARDASAHGRVVETERGDEIVLHRGHVGNRQTKNQSSFRGIARDRPETRAKVARFIPWVPARASRDRNDERLSSNLAQAPKHHRLLRVNAVFRLVPHGRMGASITASITSSPRWAGRQCKNIASGAARV